MNHCVACVVQGCNSWHNGIFGYSCETDTFFLTLIRRASGSKSSCMMPYTYLAALTHIVYIGPSITNSSIKAAPRDTTASCNSNSAPVGAPCNQLRKYTAQFQIMVLVRFGSVWLVTVLLIVWHRSLLLCPFHKKLRIWWKKSFSFCQTDNPRFSCNMYCYRYRQLTR